VPGWAERGGYLATEHGNSVPRFHLTWGSGPGLLEPFLRRVREARDQGLVRMLFRHRVSSLLLSAGAVDGVAGEVLEPSLAARGRPSSRVVTKSFELRAPAVIVTSGGIGANHELVRENWPSTLGQPPARMLSGVPDHVDGRMISVCRDAGASVINPDRMWHYTEGISNWNPVWTRHGIRILPGPSPLWFDAAGRRLPVPLFPGFDTLGTLKHICQTGYDYSWFVLTQKMIEREFALSGSEQNPDITGRSIRQVARRVRPGAPEPVESFKRFGADFVVADALPELVRKMNRLAGSELIDGGDLEREIVARDREMANPYTKDLQITAIHGARRYPVDRVTRVAAPHRILDPSAGPLIAVRLWILTRKTLGGLETDLSGRVLAPSGDGSGEPMPGLFAAGEASGFGGGGVHGYRSLEGTFLGGCVFSGRAAGRAAARNVS
jgi:predicted oxidoreductase